MANGTYTDQFEDLDIAIPESKYWDFVLYPPKAIKGYRKNVDASKAYGFWFRFANAEPEEIRNTVVCGYDGTDSVAYATRMCRALGAINEADDPKRFTLNL